MENNLQKGIDYIGVCIVYFCHDGNGKFIMAKRSENCRDEHGRWDIGGGGLEFGEEIEDAIKKEVKEEYCTEVLEYEFLGFRNVHREHNGKKTHWVTLDFKVKIDSKKVKNGEPHKFDEVKWFTLDNLPQNIHSKNPEFINRYYEKLVKIKRY